MSGLNLAADAAIDLHLHTVYSDGNWLPEQLLDHLVREQFALVAITDHDRLDTAVALQRLAQDKHLPVLVAVEMTAAWRGEMTDVLCFGFDPEHSALHELARGLLHRQQENTREVFENLARKGYALAESPAALADLLAKPGSQQPHALVSLLRRQGYGQGAPSAGEIALGAGCAYATNDLAEVVEAAHRSGAVCLIAHPGRTDGWLTYSVELLDQARHEAPIDGLEVDYPKHTPAQTAMYREYARRHHLLISSGSDSHGPDKPPVRYPAEPSRALLERLGVQVAWDLLGRPGDRPGTRNTEGSVTLVRGRWTMGCPCSRGCGAKAPWAPASDVCRICPPVADWSCHRCPCTAEGGHEVLPCGAP